MREPIKIGELAELIGAEIVGDSSVTFASIGSLASAGRKDLSHLSSNSYRKFLPSTKAAAGESASGWHKLAFRVPVARHCPLERCECARRLRRRRRRRRRARRQAAVRRARLHGLGLRRGGGHTVDSPEMPEAFSSASGCVPAFDRDLGGRPVAVKRREEEVSPSSSFVLTAWFGSHPHSLYCNVSPFGRSPSQGRRPFGHDTDFFPRLLRI